AHRHARLAARALAGAARREPAAGTARSAARRAGAHQDRRGREDRCAALAGRRPGVLHQGDRSGAARRHGGCGRARPQGPGDYDAIILAAAGLKRLGLDQHVAEYLPPEAFPPAVSQGVIGVCARTGDEPTLRWLAALDDGKARLAASAERALLRRLEGGCQVPLGALASGDQRSLELIACVCALDGSKALSASAVASASSGAGLSSADAAALGERVAAALLSRGAAGP